MQKPASRFIELLDARQLVSAEVLAELRRQVAETSANLPPELLARLLVDNGHLTKFQASKLIGEIGSSVLSSASSTTPESELGLAPSREVAEAILEIDESSENSSAEVAKDEVPVVAAGPLSSSPDSRKRSRRDATDPSQAGQASSTAAPSLDESGPVSARRSHDTDRFQVVPAEVPKIVRSKQSGDNPWDSFRILGIGVLLSLVCIVGFFLARWAIRGNADQAIKFADNAYQQRSYEDAANAYRNFAESWPTHAKSSYAKVRSVLASIRKDGETAPNPSVGLKTAEQLLPSVRDESSLTEQQGDLAGALVALAEKFISRMDSTKGTDERKSMMSEMDRLMTLMGDPQFFGSMQRTQLSPTLQRIDESRARIRREIQRDDELKLALAEMDQQLDAKEVTQAYATRSRLINRYPLLEANPDLEQKVLRASAIQKELVKDDALILELTMDPGSEAAVKTRVLSHRSGSTANDLVGTMVALLVKGTVFGVDASNGQVRWRRWVGKGIDFTPKRLSDSSDADVLVIQPEFGRLWRLSGPDGRVLWQVEVGESINEPVVLEEDIICTSPTGIMACLDSETGQTKWLKRLPQSIGTGPGASAGGRLLYQPADHSNVYIMDRRDGTCQDVFYVGHREGAIQVPPVFVLGHLLLVENTTVDTARIRVLATSENNLKQAQPHISVDGNVVHSPSVDGRQILVQSNLGNSIVLDVEPSSVNQPVTVTARVPKNLDKPQSIWTAFSRNQVWLAESRLARFDLVVTQGKLNRRWIQHEGDEFVAPMELYDQTLLHARRPKGNSGVKISAAIAESGNSIWDLDVGVPISLLHQTPNKQVDAVTSSGSYFLINNEPIRQSADSNPGEGKPLKRLSTPAWLDENRAVMLNMANPREFALYSGEGSNRLRIMTVPLGSASPTCEPVAVGQQVVVGLDNGTLVLFEPESGITIGAPYQAVPTRPGVQVQWNQPVYLPESKVLVAASNAGQMVRLSVGESLRVLAEVSLDQPVVGSLAAFGQQIAAVQSTSSGEILALWDSQTLQLADSQPLDGRLLSGPFGTSPNASAGASISHGFVQTQRGLRAYDTDGKMVWQTALSDSPLVGAPTITEDDRCIAVSRRGQVWVLNLENGQILGSLDLGQPVTTPALVVGSRVLIGSDDGTVLIVDIPSQRQLSGQE